MVSRTLPPSSTGARSLNHSDDDSTIETRLDYWGTIRYYRLKGLVALGAVEERRRLYATTKWFDRQKSIEDH